MSVLTINPEIPAHGNLAEAQPSMAGAEDFLALMKPRVMSLVVFTAFVALTVAPGHIHPVIGFAALLCVAIGAGAAGALNMWFDADIDAKMSRTAARPLPRGRIAPGEALGFGLLLAGFSVVTMGLLVNAISALLLALTIAFYVAVYTMWLKRWTPHNIVIGGAAGAFPPVIGWAAVTGGTAWPPLLMFLIIFLWTPPHFWALALVRADDYARAGVPMLPLVAGRPATRLQILIYSALLLPATIAPWPLGYAGAIYGVCAAATSLVFVAYAARLYRTSAFNDERKAARQLFTYSIFYLFLVFAAWLADYGFARAGF